jgi:hypothetical protein
MRSGAVEIDRCVCRRILFARLLPLAREHGWTLDDIGDEQCGLCRPYLRRMLQTGETVFHEILTDDAV